MIKSIFNTNNSLYFLAGSIITYGLCMTLLGTNNSANDNSESTDTVVTTAETAAAENNITEPATVALETNGSAVTSDSTVTVAPVSNISN